MEGVVSGVVVKGANWSRAESKCGLDTSAGYRAAYIARSISMQTSEESAMEDAATMPFVPLNASHALAKPVTAPGPQVAHSVQERTRAMSIPACDREQS